jgi:hypothetical protein
MYLNDECIFRYLRTISKFFSKKIPTLIDKKNALKTASKKATMPMTSLRLCDTISQILRNEINENSIFRLFQIFDQKFGN